MILHLLKTKVDLFHALLTYCFLTICRPPRHSVFLEEFGVVSRLLRVRLSYFVYCRDFNLHIDNLENTCARELLAPIDHFDLTQHAQGPIHAHGHTPHLVITKGLSGSTAVVDVALSGHVSSFFDVSMMFPLHSEQLYDCS